MAKSMPGIIIKIGANTKDAIDGLNKVNNALGKSATGTQKFSAAMRKAGPALGLAAAGAALLAVKMGTDAVRAAVEEEASVSRLNKALQNLGMGKASEATSRFVDDLQFATGVADTELRPALASLAVATGDMAEAQKSLSIAMDISAQTGKPLSAVVAALSKGYLGNTTGLMRLNAGVDKNILATGDMNKINAEFARITGGAAATAADTLAGRMAIAQIAVDELSEALGLGLVSGFTGAGDSLEDFSGRMRDMQPQVENMGQAIGGMVASALDGFTAFGLGAMKVADAWDDAGAAFTRFVINTRDWAGEITDEQADAERSTLDMADAQREAAMRAFALGGAQQDAATETNRHTTAAESNARTMDRQKASADRLKKSLDNLNDKRSILRQRINLRKMIEEGPQGTGKKGAVTARDKRLFALDIADARAQLGEDIFNQGGKGSKVDARRQFELGRGNIRALGLRPGLPGDILPTPGALRRGSGLAPGTPQTGQQVAGINYNFYGGINVTSGQAAQQAAKEARRLAALSGSRYAGMAETGRGY